MHFPKSALIIASAVTVFTSIPNSALAESVSVSTSISAQINVEVTAEVNPEKKSKDYTGVIIDCRGLDLRRVMSPVIKNENGKIIYGDKDLDCDKITEIGMASYATSMNDVARAGSHPLIVKAVKLLNFNSNPVLSNADAHKVLITNEISGYLKKLNVVFLMD